MGFSGRLSTLGVVTLGLTALPAVDSLYIGGGLTILSRNNLDGVKNEGSAAILVSQPSPYEAGSTSCTLLGEQPWASGNQDVNSELASALGYLEYQETARKEQRYWISKSACSPQCRAIDAKGKIHKVDCQKELPTLCTQSASVSTSKFDNNSAHWQVQQFVGNKLLTGYRDHHVWKFRGIRFADKPVRFEYSKAASFEDEGEVDATVAGADCSQPIGEVTSGSSEDCLFANVWTPYLPRSGGQDKKSQLKPVMLYLYGGGFTSGSGKNTNTDGTNLASRGDVVVVSVNYRVGSLGFLNFNDGVHDGNYAISDFVSALEWVNKYIKYFGGDPDRVTLFGESAGAMSTHYVLGVPKAKGLFHRAVMQSSPDGWPSPNGNKLISYVTYDNLERNYETTTKKVLAQAGCSDAADKIACLSKLSGFELVNLPTNANGLVVDGTYVTIPQLIVNSSSLSLATNVDVMLGHNRDEAGINVDIYPTANDTFLTYFDRAAAQILGGSIPADVSLSALIGLNKLTPSTPFPGLPPAIFDTTNPPAPEIIFNATMHFFTDALFACYTFAKTYSAARHAAWKSAHYFEFNRSYQPAGYTRTWCEPPKDDPKGEYYKCHAGEQLVVFGNAVRAGLPDRDGLDVKFMQLVVDYWAAFARNGDPNPERGWLEARGYEGTLGEVERVGKWEAVEVGGGKGPTMRVLQWGGRQVGLGEGHNEVCKGLGIPLDVLEP